MTGGLRIYLHADHRGPVDEGTPINFRGLPIGRVVALGLPTAGQRVVFVCEIQRGYAHLIRENTVFWHRERARADINPQALGLGGFRVEFPRLNSALRISLDAATPNDPGPMSQPGRNFDIQDTPPRDLDDWSPDLTPLVDPFPEPTPQQLEIQESEDSASAADEKKGPIESIIDFLIFFD